MFFFNDKLETFYMVEVLDTPLFLIAFRINKVSQYKPLKHRENVCSYYSYHVRGSPHGTHPSNG